MTDASTDRPAWTPSDSSPDPTRCQNCGEKVTPRFARVFGTNGDVVHACTECTDNRRLPRLAAGLEVTLRSKEDDNDE